MVHFVRQPSYYITSCFIPTFMLGTLAYFTFMIHIDDFNDRCNKNLSCRFTIWFWISTNISKVYGILDRPACACFHDACLHWGTPKSLLHQGTNHPFLTSLEHFSSPAHRCVAAVLPDQHDDQHLHPHPGGLPQEIRARVREGARGGQADHCQGWRGVHARRGDDWDGNWLQMVKLHRNEHKRPKWLKNGAITPKSTLLQKIHPTITLFGTFP